MTLKQSYNSHKALYIAGAVLLIGGLAYILLHKQKATTQAQASTQDLTTLASQGIQPTLQSSDYFSLATRLDSDLDSFFIPMDDILAVFAEMNNVADIISLINSYGTNGTVFHFGLGYIGTFTLPQFMAERLSNDELSQINSALATKNINYKF